MDQLKMEQGFADRNVNEGFSGGEKKRHEIHATGTVETPLCRVG